MRISLKNIALALGVAAGATVAAVVISKKPAKLFSNKNSTAGKKAKHNNDGRNFAKETDKDTLYI